MKRIFLLLVLAASFAASFAALPRVYDETIDPMAQLDSALVRAKAENKYVLAQVGGNWCPWCLRFADFVTKDAEIKEVVDSSYVYIHLNYPRTGASDALTRRIACAGRFGFPVLVIFSPDGGIVHIQDTGLLEAGEGYDREKVLRTLSLWSPQESCKGR